MAVEIRRATPADAGTIAEFAILLSEQHQDYDPKRFVALADREGAKWFYGSQTEADDAAVLIAEDRGNPVGFAYLQYQANSYAELLESAAWLHDIYVVAPARGSGAGKKLIEAAKKAAKELGATKLVLHVAERNASGQDFFKRAGFRTTMLEMTLDIKA
ncbi:MAG: GNAT family N-acetyltransferase [Acidobacteriota bacterium]